MNIQNKSEFCVLSCPLDIYSYLQKKAKMSNKSMSECLCEIVMKDSIEQKPRYIDKTTFDQLCEESKLLDHCLMKRLSDR